MRHPRLGSNGYTIVEVMIFLAVSGLMFLIAATFIDGKQSKAEFRQGIDEINSQIQRTISDVSNGFYPSGENFGCDISSGSPVLIPASGNEQGSNQGCIFMGKVIQFGVDDAGGSEQPSAYSIYSIVGRQYVGDPSTNSPTSFAEAQPAAAYSSSGIDLTDNRQLKWGLRVTGMFSGSAQIGAIGFFGSFGQYGGDSLSDGSQTTTAVVIPNSQRGQTQGELTGLIKNHAGDLDTELNNNPNPDITICFDNGSGEYGSLNIGGANGQRLSTKIRVSNKPLGAPCPA